MVKLSGHLIFKREVDKDKRVRNVTQDIVEDEHLQLQAYRTLN